MKKVLAVMMAAAVAAAAAAPAMAESGREKLVAMTDRAVESYDPFTVAGYDTTTMNQIYDTLLMWDENGDVTGRLAESWTEEEDGVTITMKLREGVQFTDGTLVDADAVIWNYEHLRDGLWGGSFAGYISNVEKVDDSTIAVTKATPASTALDILCYFLFVVSPTAYEADPEGFGMNPVGSGAYIFAGKDEATGTVTLTANEDYFLGAPQIKTVEVIEPLESGTALAALQNGELDYAMNLVNTDLQIADADPNVTAMTSVGWSTLTMMLDGEPLCSDQNLRSAIAYGINRENAALFNNELEYIPCNDLFSANVMKDISGTTQASYYDPEKAAEYLAASSYDGSVLPINTLSIYENVATSIQADLAAIGINTQINEIDRATWSEMMTNGTLSISTIDFGGVYNGPVEMMSYFVSSGYYGAMGIFECTDECDAAFEKLYTITDAEELKDATIEAVQLMSDLNNFVSLYEMIFTSACSADLNGVQPVWSANQAPYFYQVTA